MNIFVLDSKPRLAAEYHCDKHVIKMILESAQLLSTAHRVLDGTECIRISPGGRKLKDYKLDDLVKDELLYKATHVNHPCAIWAREAVGNYIWLHDLFYCLCKEYTLRYNKIHLTESKLLDLLCEYPQKISGGPITPFVQAMPDEYKVSDDAVTAYRNYYLNDKADIAVWKYSQTPFWWNKNGESIKL